MSNCHVPDDALAFFSWLWEGRGNPVPGAPSVEAGLPALAGWWAGEVARGGTPVVLMVSPSVLPRTLAKALREVADQLDAGYFGTAPNIGDIWAWERAYTVREAPDTRAGAVPAPPGVEPLPDPVPVTVGPRPDAMNTPKQSRWRRRALGRSVCNRSTFQRTTAPGAILGPCRTQGNTGSGSPTAPGMTRAGSPYPRRSVPWLPR